MALQTRIPESKTTHPSNKAPVLISQLLTNCCPDLQQSILAHAAQLLERGSVERERRAMEAAQRDKGSAASFRDRASQKRHERTSHELSDAVGSPALRSWTLAQVKKGGITIPGP